MHKILLGTHPAVRPGFRSAPTHSHRSIRISAISKSCSQDFAGKSPPPLFMNVRPFVSRLDSVKPI
jgi:hypothetical protein